MESQAGTSLYQWRPSNITTSQRRAIEFPVPSKSRPKMRPSLPLVRRSPATEREKQRVSQAGFTPGAAALQHHQAAPQFYLDPRLHSLIFYFPCDVFFFQSKSSALQFPVCYVHILEVCHFVGAHRHFLYKQLVQEFSYIQIPARHLKAHEECSRQAKNFYYMWIK